MDFPAYPQSKDTDYLYITKANTSLIDSNMLQHRSDVQQLSGGLLAK